MTNRRGRIKRAIRTVIVFLLLGAIVNVAVAWWFALVGEQEASTRIEPAAVPDRWPAYLRDLDWPAPDHAEERIGLGVVGDAVGVTILDIEGGDRDASWSGPGRDKTLVSLEVRRFGLPWRAMQFEIPGVVAGSRSMSIVKAARTAAGTRVGIDVSDLVGATQNQALRALPLTPLWPGFAINTIFYAVVLWLPFLGVGILRRRRRIKRGLCPSCTYPMGTSGVCTECGQQLERGQRSKGQQVNKGVHRDWCGRASPLASAAECCPRKRGMVWSTEDCEATYEKFIESCKKPGPAPKPPAIR
jgi:hypothetical protein